jgi:putative PIN family toxin of toxin-antitoxin system
VVLDTNVLISALLFTGAPSGLVPLWQNGVITVLLSRAILDEYLRVLTYPRFHLTEEEIRALVEDELLPYFEVVNPKKRQRVIRRDPSDDKFLECAVAGRADVIVSGDSDLLELGNYQRIRIQSPAAFLAAIKR